MEFQGRFYYAVRTAAKLTNVAQCDTPPRESFLEPAVYICRHSNIRGPLVSMLNVPIAVHPWSLHVFCDTEACRKHYAEYTFSVRFGWKQWKANLVAWLIAPAFSGLIRSAGSIPVWRNSSKVRETFRQSLEALQRGESLLIFPDIDYTAEEGETGKLYEGFLMLERMYFREEGKHIPFVPMHLSDEMHKMVLGEPVVFHDGIPFGEEKNRVATELHGALNELLAIYGA